MKMRADGRIEAFDSIYTLYKENSAYKVYINPERTKWFILTVKNEYVNNCAINRELSDLSYYGL